MFCLFHESMVRRSEVTKQEGLFLAHATLPPLVSQGLLYISSYQDPPKGAAVI